MTITTLNISSTAIKYLVLKGGHVAKQGSVLPAGPVKNGSILQPEIIAGQLKSLFASEKLPGNSVICSVNGLPFSYRLFTLPRMAPEAFTEALLRAARKEMPVVLEEMYLTWQAYPAENDEWQVLVSGITRQPIDNLLTVLANAGIRPSFLDLQQLSLVRLANQKDAIIVDFENDYSNIVIVADGVPVAMQIVPSLGPGAAPQEEVRQITDRVSKMVEFYNGTHTGKPVKDSVKIILTGGQVNDNGAIDLIREEAMFPVELPDLATNGFSGMPLHEYAANAGSALLTDGNGKNAEGDLAPHHYINLGNIGRERKASKKSGNVLVKVAVPLAIVVALGTLAPAWLSRTDLQARATQAQADLAQANIQYNQTLEAVNAAAAVESNISEIQANTQKIISNTQAILDRADYTGDVAFITGAMPQGVSYTSITITSGSISITGDANAASPVVQLARNLESSGGYSKADINWINKPPAEKVSVGVSFLINIIR
jgi:Tfp pilus assembly PilM family ATPase